MMRIRQIVFAAQDLPASRALLASLFALDKPYRDPGVAKFGVDNAVFSFGDQFIEVISPVEPGTACGRHLARLGDSGYMLILQTDDLARERQRLSALGVRSVWQADLDDIAATHLHPKDVGGAIISIDQPRPASAWRWGGPNWQIQPGPAGRQRVRGIHLRAHQPQAMAERWAQVLGLAPPVAAGDGWRLTLDAGFADFGATAAASQPEGVTGFSLAVADPSAVLDRARASGVPVVGSVVRSVVGPVVASVLRLLGADMTIAPL